MDDDQDPSVKRAISNFDKAVKSGHEVKRALAAIALLDALEDDAERKRRRTQTADKAA